MTLPTSCRRGPAVTTLLHAGPKVVNRESPTSSPGQTAPAMIRRPALTHRTMSR